MYQPAKQEISDRRRLRPRLQGPRAARRGPGEDEGLL